MTISTTEQSGALYEELDELQLEQCNAGLIGAAAIFVAGIVATAATDTVVEKVTGKSLTDWTGLAVGSAYDYLTDESVRRDTVTSLQAYLTGDLGIDLGGFGDVAENLLYSGIWDIPLIDRR